MSDNYVHRDDRKHCLHCPQSYCKTVSTNTLNAHFTKMHKHQPSISMSTVNSKTKIANEQLSSNLAKAFSLLNWPLHHIKSQAFTDIVSCIRQSSVNVACKHIISRQGLSRSVRYTGAHLLHNMTASFINCVFV